MSDSLLVIEDLDSDFEMMSRSLRRLGVPACLVRMRGLNDTLQYLENAEVIPRMIVLDLFLMDGDGLELLEKIKRHPFWNNVPIVIWSSHSDPAIGEACVHRGARTFYRKVADIGQLQHTMSQIADNWQNCAR